MIKKILFFVFSSALVFSATIYYRLGAYKKVEIVEATKPELLVLYKEHFGPYHKIAEVISEVESWALAHNLDCEKTFGEYLDDPRIVEERRLRSHGGCIISQQPKEKTPYQVKSIAEGTYVIATFKGAPSLGPLKVYPKAEEYFKSRRWTWPKSIIEIYEFSDPNNPVTEYLFRVTELLSRTNAAL